MSVCVCTDLLQFLKCGIRIPPAVIQNEFSARLPDDEMIKFCKAQKPPIACIAACPLGSQMFPKDPLVNDDVVRRVAQREGCTAAQALLMFNAQRGVATIPKPDTIDQMRENIDTLQIRYKLADTSMTELRALEDVEKTFGAASAKIGMEMHGMDFMSPEMIILSDAAQAAIAQADAHEAAMSLAETGQTPQSVAVIEQEKDTVVPDFLAEGLMRSEAHGLVSGFHAFLSHRVWCEKDTAEKMFLTMDDKRLRVTEKGRPIRSVIYLVRESLCLLFNFSMEIKISYRSSAREKIATGAVAGQALSQPRRRLEGGFHAWHFEQLSYCNSGKRTKHSRHHRERSDQGG